MSQDLVEFDPSQFTTGMDDLDGSDLSVPRVSIDHKAGEFKDSLTGATFKEIDFIPLALVKQRVMWKPAVEDNDSPLCKSTDNKMGFPTTWEKPSDNFPWGASGFKITDFPLSPDGQVTIPCESCKFKEWKSHPDGKKPWCSQQHAVPMLYGEAGSDSTFFTQAVFTMQRSSMGASRQFFAGIQQRGLPAFGVLGRMTLTQATRGQNIFYIPALKVMRQTPKTDWMEYSRQSKGIQDFLNLPPVTKDNEGNILVPEARSTIKGPQVQITSFVATDAFAPRDPFATIDVTATPAGPVEVATPVATPVVAQSVVTPATPLVVSAPSSSLPTVAAPVIDDDSLPF